MAIKISTSGADGLIGAAGAYEISGLAGNARTQELTPDRQARDGRAAASRRAMQA